MNPNFEAGGAPRDDQQIDRLVIEEGELKLHESGQVRLHGAAGDS
jgi:hypothetical protein